MKTKSVNLHLIFLVIVVLELIGTVNGSKWLDYPVKPFILIWIAAYFLIMTKPQPYRWLVILAFFFSWAGDMLLMFGWKSDMFFFAYTQMIILRQRRYTEVQRDFINTMTHEFKTPLASLSMSADVIQRPDILQDPERLFRYGEIIRGQVNHLLKQVELVLEMGGPAGDKLLIKKVPVRLKVVIGEICELMEPRVHHSQGSLTLNYQSKTETIEADPLHLTNIILNLLDNGLKYSGDVPVITVSVTDSAIGLVIEVRDRGIGIPAKLKKRVFDKFYRVPTGNVRDAKGFGLGLYYTRNAVRMHGWKINLESKEGEGTTIRIIIPAKMS